MLFKEGTVPMQTHLVSGGSPIMTSQQKPVVSNTLDPPPAGGTYRPPPGGVGQAPRAHDKINIP